LIQIFIVYFGLPQLGLRLSPFLSGLGALVLYAAAYNAEIFRAGLEAVPKGQHEAALSGGLSPAQALRFVIVPQAVRIAFPALGLAVGLLRVLPGRAGTVVGGAVELVRAVPLLLLLFFIFFGLPALGVRIPTFPAAVLAMSLWMAANTAEVVRGGVQSISRGQFEAARSLELGWASTLRFVILPQATRRMPPRF